MSEEIYVIPSPRTPLLGVTAIEALGLAAQLQVVASGRIERSSSRIPSSLQKDLCRISNHVARRSGAVSYQRPS